MVKLDFLTWNATNACDLKCKHCYASSGSAYENELTYDEVKESLVDQLDILKCSNLLISGGEPLNRKDIFDIIDYIKSKNINIAIASNGIQIDDDLAKKLENHGVKSIQISLESSNENENDEIRGLGTFKKIIRALSALSKTSIYTTIAATPTYELSKIEDLILLAKELNVNMVSIRRFIPIGRGEFFDRKYKLYSRKDFLKFIYNIQEKYNTLVKINCDDPLYITLSPNINDLYKKDILAGCLAGINSCAVDATGEVYPCTRLKYSLGNIKNMNLEYIWKNNKDLKSLRDRNLLEGKCKICNYKFLCGGCRAGAYNKSGNILAEDPDCFNNISCI